MHLRVGILYEGLHLCLLDVRVKRKSEVWALRGLAWFWGGFGCGFGWALRGFSCFWGGFEVWFWVGPARFCMVLGVVFGCGFGWALLGFGWALRGSGSGFGWVMHCFWWFRNGFWVWF